MILPLSPEDCDRIARDLDGTCSSGDLQVEEYGRSMTEIVEAANIGGVVRCECGYWVRNVNERGECVECQQS